MSVPYWETVCSAPEISGGFLCICATTETERKSVLSVLSVYTYPVSADWTRTAPLSFFLSLCIYNTEGETLVCQRVDPRSCDLPLYRSDSRIRSSLGESRDFILDAGGGEGIEYRLPLSLCERSFVAAACKGNEKKIPSLRDLLERRDQGSVRRRWRGM